MSRRVLGKSSFHSLLCLSDASPPFLGANCQLGCLQSWCESSCRSESNPSLLMQSVLQGFIPSSEQNCPPCRQQTPQPWACRAWCWLKLNIQLCGFLRLFFGNDKDGLRFLPQVQIVICLVNGSARENDMSQEFQQLQVCQHCTCMNLPLHDFSQHHPCQNKAWHLLYCICEWLTSSCLFRPRNSQFFFMGSMRPVLPSCPTCI